MSTNPWPWPTSKPAEPAEPETITITEPNIGWVSDLDTKSDPPINPLSVAVGFVVALALSLLFVPLLFAAFM